MTCLIVYLCDIANGQSKSSNKGLCPAGSRIRRAIRRVLYLDYKGDEPGLLAMAREPKRIQKTMEKHSIDFFQALRALPFS